MQVLEMSIYDARHPASAWEVIMEIQRLTPSHASNYRALMLEAYELHPDAFTSSVAERAALPLSWWESRLDVTPQPVSVVFGAVENEQLLGVTGLLFESREKIRHKATLFGMYVPSRFRKRQVGHQLLQAALHCAEARREVSIIQLTVTEGNFDAQSLYERCGFKPFAVEPFAVATRTGFVSKVHMWREV